MAKGKSGQSRAKTSQDLDPKTGQLKDGPKRLKPEERKNSGKLSRGLGRKS